MSHSNAVATAGEVNKRVPWSRDLLLLLGVGVAGVWVVWSFAQEAVVDQRMAFQASQLRAQNSALAAQNQGYQKDIEAMTSGAAAEEEARLNGYARSDEKLYLVSRPTAGAGAASPAPAAAPAAARKVQTDEVGPVETVRRWLVNRWPR